MSGLALVLATLGAVLAGLWAGRVLHKESQASKSRLASLRGQAQRRALRWLMSRRGDRGRDEPSGGS